MIYVDTRIRRLAIEGLPDLARVALEANPPPAFVYGDTDFYLVTPAVLAHFNITVMNMRRKLRADQYAAWKVTHDRLVAVEALAFQEWAAAQKAEYRAHLSDGYVPSPRRPYAPTVVYPDEEPPRPVYRNGGWVVPGDTSQRWADRPHQPVPPNADRTSPYHGFFPAGYNTSQERRIAWVEHLRSEGVFVPGAILRQLGLPSDDPLDEFDPSGNAAGINDPFEDL